jgi:hypothetical protein
MYYCLIRDSSNLEVQVPVFTPAKRSAYQIHSETAVFVVLVCRVWFVSFPKATRGLEPISYRGALLSTLLHATVYLFHTICWVYWYRLQIKWDYKKYSRKQDSSFLKDTTFNVMMVSKAETRSVICSKEKKRSEHQPKLHVDGNSET